MNRSFDILAVLMLVVYGTLTLVAVPMHHHALEFVDTPQYHSTNVNHGVDCSVCTFSTTSIVVGPSPSVSLIDRGVDAPLNDALHTVSSVGADLAFSRRGPPSILS